MGNMYPFAFGILSYTLLVCADPQDTFQIPMFATFPSRLCRRQTEGPMRVSRVRHLRHFYPVAGLRHWISQRFPFLDGNGDLNDSKRSIYDNAKQNRWKNAINQIGAGTGLTEDEKAEAARIRRAKLVAQDPQYTQRLFGSSISAGNNRQTQPPAGLRLQERMQRATELWQHRIQSKREKQSSVMGEGTWGELNKVESPSEQHARKERSAQLQEDAARTLGERARYFSIDSHSTARVQKNNDISTEKTRIFPSAPPTPLASSSKIAVESKSAKTQPAATTRVLGTEAQGFPVQRSSAREAPQSDKGVLADVPYAAQDLTRVPARDLLALPLLLEDEQEVAEESVWKVIAPKGVAVLVQPEDEAAALGRLRGMQMVEVELAMGPWLKLKRTAGWVRAQGGTRGKEIYMVRQGKQLGF